MTDLPEKEHMPPTPESPEAGVPKEVTSAGVQFQPTTIPIPKPVSDLGVTPGPANIPMPTSVSSFPITDDQIAEGLRKNVRDSWLWLAEWCIRQLKKVHVGLKYIRGKLVRTYA